VTLFPLDFAEGEGEDEAEGEEAAGAEVVAGKVQKGGQHIYDVSSSLSLSSLIATAPLAAFCSLLSSSLSSSLSSC